MIYNTIDTLPAWNFYKILETGDYKYLYDDMVIKKIDECEYIFNDIIDDVNTILGVSSNIEEQDSILRLKNKYLALCNIISVLKIKDNKDETYNEFIDWLKQNGYKYDDTTFENRYESILYLERQLHGLKTKIELKTPEQKESVRFNMYDMNVKISKHIGFHVNMKEISILEYSTIINDFIKN